MSYKIKVKTSPYVMLSCDYSRQEPAITSLVSNDMNMIQAFKDGKDIYSIIASYAFNLPYESCLEFNPVTHEYQKEGKARRGEAKTIVLGICYGRSVASIGDQLYGSDPNLDDDAKTKKAQKVYDAVLGAFPNLRRLMRSAQHQAETVGYVKTILGRRRHIPDMMLKPFEFEALPGYVNPDIDPLDPSTFSNESGIPKRIVDQLEAEFSEYKTWGKIVKRTKELKDDNIRVINNRPKIRDASRQCVNCVDRETEILTLNGWRRYDEISEEDEIYSYDIENNLITKDTIVGVHLYEGDTEVIGFKSKTFDSLSTPDHRWVMCANNEHPRFTTTENIGNSAVLDNNILRISDNDLCSSCTYDYDQLKLIGWMLTCGDYNKAIKDLTFTYFMTKGKLDNNYYRFRPIFRRMDLEYREEELFDDFKDSNVLHVTVNDKLESILMDFPDMVLTNEFIQSLNQNQARTLVWYMLEACGNFVKDKHSLSFSCDSEIKRDRFQYLCVIAGYATNSYTKEIKVSYIKNDKIFDTLETRYLVSVLLRKRSNIGYHQKYRDITDFVWCVTTNNGTWIARRHGSVYITGNSIIQGSAADMTKMGILALQNNEEWNAIGGRLLVPIHDELLCEVPQEEWEHGGDVLSSIMVSAANFMPFKMTCDVDTTIRWSGLEYPCPYKKPKSILEDDEESVSWIQYHLCEMEYDLPVYKNENGESPIGNANKGVNGKVSDSYFKAIEDYKKRFNVSDDDFIDHIEKNVEQGLVD